MLPRAVRALVRPRSIKAKLSRILMISLVLVLMVLVATSGPLLAKYRDAEDTERVVSLSLSVQELVHSLQKERGLTNGLLAGGGFYRPSVIAQRLRTDAALEALTGKLADPAHAGATAGDVRRALDRLGALAIVRGDVDTGRTFPTLVFAFYTEATEALNRLGIGLSRARDLELRHGLESLYQLSYAKDFADRQRGLLNGVFSAGRFGPGQYEEFVRNRVNEQISLEAYRRVATPAQHGAVETALRSVVARKAAGFELLARDSLGGPLRERVDAQDQWWNLVTLVINDLRKVQQQVGADITARAGELRRDALGQLMGFTLLALVAVAVEAALVVGAIRSIIGPLSALASAAHNVAVSRLPRAVAASEEAHDSDIVLPEPEPVVLPAHAGTEIRQVADALGALEGTALTLAGRQAAMRVQTTAALVNLGRRSQNLVRRQLKMISDFEREELDPGALANMFQLDHLATRMRRNAESLLVLAGETGSRTWSAPLPAVEVVRSALSEIEDYPRVALKHIDDGQIAGPAAADTAHMLAELIENGLAFSSPGSEVEVHGRRTGSTYTLAVVDHGIGMPRAALDQANARLRDAERFLSAPSRRLGHYVVGRLAARLGAEVSLAPGAVCGVAARVVLPAEILVPPAERQETSSARPTAS